MNNMVKLISNNGYATLISSRLIENLDVIGSVEIGKYTDPNTLIPYLMYLSNGEWRLLHGLLFQGKCKWSDITSGQDGLTITRYRDDVAITYVSKDGGISWKNSLLNI